MKILSKFIIKRFIQLVITAGLLILFFFVIRGDVTKIKKIESDVSIVSILTTDPEQLLLRSKIINLNYSFADLQQLINLHEAHLIPTENILRNYVSYYKYLSDLLPKSGEINGIIGFLYYYLND